MKIRLWFAGTLVLAMSVIANGQTLSPIQDTGKRVGTVALGGLAMPAMEGQSMPMEKIDKPTLLDDQLEAIRTAIPDFNSVIVREAGVPADFPTLPAMALKNVSLGQFLQFVQACFPGVRIVRIDGPAGSLYSVRIAQDDNAMRRAAMISDQNRVRLYRLNDMISAQADDAATRSIVGKKPEEVTNVKPRDEQIKDATNQILSLLQAALDQTDSDGPMSIKIHEPTLTLMFKGSKAKQTVLEEALDALQPRGSKPFRTTPRMTSDGSNPFGGGGGWSGSSDAFQLREAAMAEQLGRMDEAGARTEAAMKTLKAKPVPVAPVAPVAPVPPAVPNQKD